MTMDGFSVLHLAAHKGNVPICTVLLQFKADVTACRNLIDKAVAKRSATELTLHLSSCQSLSSVSASIVGY